MEFIYVTVLSAVSMAVLFVITKLMGFRQISEMSFFDYIIGITIGSVAAEMSTNIDLEWWKGVTAMAVYGIIGILLSVITQKSIAARKFISGQTIIIIEKGKIIKENLKKAKIEINDLLTSARCNGYFNLSDIDYAIMETTGKISFLPVGLKRQLTPQDFNFAPENDGLQTNVIIDGRIMKEDLKRCSMTENQLKNQLKSQGKKVQDVMLATVDDNKTLRVWSLES